MLVGLFILIFLSLATIIPFCADRWKDDNKKSEANKKNKRR